MKYIVIVPDGMWDEKCEELGGLTPLEAARTTNMDYLAQHGMTGRVQTIPQGMHPGSDIGNMSIFGYAPQKYHTGRAPIEAANLGIDLAEDELAFRMNLITELDGKLADYSAGHITDKEAVELIDDLRKACPWPDMTLYAGKSYRHIMVLKTPKADEFLKIPTFAPHDILGQPIAKFLPKGPHSERLLALMEKSEEVFKEHPVNNVRVDLGENPATMVWLWGQGKKPQLPPFKEKYGIKGGGVISAVDLIHGIGKLAGLKSIEVPGITGYYDTNYAGKAEEALAFLKKNDFVYIHIEAPDEAGHNGDARAKMDCIEKIDQEIVGRILNTYGEHDNVRILLLPDHPTPVHRRTHTSDPVGFILFGKGISHDGSQTYTEASCAEKDLTFASGAELMDYFMSAYA